MTERGPQQCIQVDKIREGVRGGSQALSGGAQQQGKDQWAQIETQEVLHEDEEKLLYFGSDRTLEQIPGGS